MKSEDRIKQAKILAAFRSGIVLTVAQAHRMAHTTELRRIVSRLRKQGYEIKDYRDNSGSFKHYYMERPLPAKGTKMENFGLPKMEFPE